MPNTARYGLSYIDQTQSMPAIYQMLTTASGVDEAIYVRQLNIDQLAKDLYEVPTLLGSGQARRTVPLETELWNHWEDTGETSWVAEGLLPTQATTSASPWVTDLSPGRAYLDGKRIQSSGRSFDVRLVEPGSPLAFVESTGGSILADTQRYYAITARNTAGETSGSPVFSATTGSATNTNRIILTWVSVAGASDYRVWRGTSASVLFLLGTASSASFIDTGQGVDSGTSKPTSNSAGVPSATFSLRMLDNESFLWTTASSADGLALATVMTNASGIIANISDQRVTSYRLDGRPISGHLLQSKRVREGMPLHIATDEVLLLWDEIILDDEVTVDGDLVLLATADSDSAGGPKKTVNGSAVSPSWSFWNDPGVGLYRAGSNQLGISTACAMAVFIDANQFVGLGVTPQTRLDLGQGALTFDEMTTPPGNGPANSARLYARDNGSGKTQIVAIFASGSAVVVATEP